jgi:Tol biopolymer transport system component
MTPIKGPLPSPEMERKLSTFYRAPVDPAFLRRLETTLADRAKEMEAGQRGDRKDLRSSMSNFGLAGALVLAILVIALIGVLSWALPKKNLPTGEEITAPGLYIKPSQTPILSTNTPLSTGSPNEGLLPVLSDTFSGRIAFQSRRDGNAEIYTMNADGSDKTNLTRNPAQDTDPAWSPDGQWIAFLSDRTGKQEVFVMNAYGGQVTQLTDNPGITWFAPLAWSPNGQQLAVSGGEDESRAHLYLVDLDGSGSRVLLDSLYGQSPKWSPDGQSLAFLGFGSRMPGLYVIGVQGDNLIEIPANQASAESYGVLIDSFDWSPDGKQLVFLSEGPWQGSWPNQKYAPGARAQFKLFDMNSSDLTTLLDLQKLPNGIRLASWSPDGQNILFIQDEIKIGNGCLAIHLIPLDGSGVRDDSPDLCYLMRTAAPDWTPDGQWLVLPAAIDGNWEKVAIYAIPVDFPLINPKNLAPFRLTDEVVGLDINPQVQPYFKPLSIEPKPVRAGETARTETPTQ